MIENAQEKAGRDVGAVGAAAARIEEALGRAEHMAEMLAGALADVLDPVPPRPGEAETALLQEVTAPLARSLDSQAYRLEALGDLLADLRARVAL